VRASVFLAFEIEAWNAAKNLEPLRGIATDLDLRFDGPKGVEGLVQEVAHHARLGLVAGRADVVDGEVIVHAHVGLDETRHLPVVASAIEALEQQDVAPAGGAAVALALALLIRMRKGRTDSGAQCRGVTRLGSPDTIGQTSFFHAASCVPTA
jgi:hypothetical protein